MWEINEFMNHDQDIDLIDITKKKDSTINNRLNQKNYSKRKLKEKRIFRFFIKQKLIGVLLLFISVLLLKILEGDAEISLIGTSFFAFIASCLLILGCYGMFLIFTGQKILPID